MGKGEEIAEMFIEREELAYQAAFAFWRMHMWMIHQGSYNQIEAKVAKGKLTPFICPKKRCDCKWPKGDR